MDDLSQLPHVRKYRPFGSDAYKGSGADFEPHLVMPGNEHLFCIG
jgi:hypothetical protein